MSKKVISKASLASFWWVVLGFLLLVAGGITSYRSTKELTASNQWVQHTLEVINKLESISRDLVFLESQQRGYIVTGDEHFISNRESESATVYQALQALRVLTADNPEQQKAITEVENTVAAKMAFMNDLINERELRGYQSARRILLQGQGRRLMYRVEQSIKTSKGIEEVLLAQRTQKAQNYAERSRDATLAVDVLAILVFIWAVIRMGKELELRHLVMVDLNETSRRLQSVLDGSTEVAVIATDLQGLITVFNRGAERLLGYSADEMVGKQTPRAFHLDSEIETRGAELAVQEGRPISGFDVFVERARQGIAETREWTYVKKSGDRLTVSLSVTAIRDGNGAVSGFLGIATDVTQRKADEEAIVAARQVAEEATRAKSKFLASMSHELRTPMNAIIGFSEILADQKFGPLNAKQEKYVGNILRGGRHLLQLINNILDLSKVEAGRMELRYEAFEVSPVVEEVSALIRPLVSKKTLALEVAVEPGLPPLTADLAQFKQILFNLSSNAVKFTPEGGRVLVAVRSDLDKATGARLLRLTVTDTGIGLKDSDQEHVFGVFAQADSSYARQQEGTGLGLALTRHLVELHGGRIWVESAGEGRGSAFTAILPMQPSGAPIETAVPATPIAEAQPGSRAAVLSAQAGGRLPLALVIEDDPAAQGLLRHYLTEAGFEVVQAGSGEHGLDLARDLRPTVITLDLLLPGHDGLDVLAKLKSAPETQPIPVIIVSILENQTVGLALGATDYFVKPVVRERFLEAVQRAVGDALGKRPKTILVVDDDPDVLEVIGVMLQDAGYRVLKASHGREGIALARSNRPDGIVLDLLMPEINGFEVLQNIRAHPDTRAIPVLIFTNKDLTEEERRRLIMQTHAVISKKNQTAQDELLRAIAEAAHAANLTKT